MEERISSRGGALAGERARRARFVVVLGLGAFAYRGLLAYPDLPQFEYTLGFWLLQPGSTWPALAVAGAFWLLLRRRARFLAAPERGAPALAAPLLAVAAAALVWANLRGATALLVLSLAAGALGLAALRRGRVGCRAILLPVAFLVFALPTPPPLANELVWKLQLWTAQLSGLIVNATGTPAVVETLVVSRPGYSFLVIESCTGWRVAEILTAAAVLLREGCLAAGHRSWWPVLAAPFLAFALNTVRIAAIVIAPDPQAVGDHRLQAAVLVTLGVALLAALALALRRRGSPPPRDPVPPAVLGSATAATLAAALLLAIFPGPWRGARAAAPIPIPMPREGAAWTSEGVEPDRTFLGTVRFDAVIEREYWRGDENVNVFVGIERGNLPRSSGRSPKTLLPGTGWHLQHRETLFLDPIGRPVDAAVVTVGNEIDALVLHWRTRDPGLVRETLANLLGLRRPGRAVIRLTTPLAGESPEDRVAAQETLRSFAADFREFLASPVAAPAAGSTSASS